MKHEPKSRHEWIQWFHSLRDFEKDQSVADMGEHVDSFVEMRNALIRACEDSDYCYVCDHHPSTGHAQDCVLSV